MGRLRNLLARNANNFQGWRTKRKIIVFESDDWGSICMPSGEVYQKLLQQGIRADQCPYASYDSLAGKEDLELLFTVLTGFRDSTGSHPVITANTVMTNPDFEKVAESGFESYFYEPFTESLSRYPSCKNSFDIWKKGLDEGLFFPQFHGREHLNIRLWMEKLRNPESIYRKVFEDRATWLGRNYDSDSGISIRAAYDTNNIRDLESHETAVEEGLQLFFKIFGFKSESFIAPNYIYHSQLNRALHNNGVRYIQGMKYQKQPRLGKSNRGMIRRYQGEENFLGQYHLVRNCVFEPSLYPETHDSVSECLKGIKNAFFWKKPAVISAHRLNFVGRINPENRERNLKQFRELLEKIMKQWPDAEFMNSAELGRLIELSSQNEGLFEK